MSIRPSQSTNEAYQTILKGLEEGHRVGYDNVQERFIDIKDPKSIDRGTQGTDLRLISAKIEKFIQENPTLTKDQISTLKSAIEARAGKLEKRATGLRGVFMFGETKEKIAKTVTDLRSIETKVDTAFQKVHQTTPSKGQQQEKIPPQLTTSPKTKETSQPSVLPEPPSSDKIIPISSIQTSAPSTDVVEETAPPPPEEFVDEEGAPPPPPPPMGTLSKPVEKLLKGEKPAPTFERTKFEKEDKKAIEDQMQEISNYVGITVPKDKAIGEFDPATGQSKLIRDLETLEEAHKGIEETISEDRKRLAELKEKKTRLETAKTTLESFEKSTSTATTIKVAGEDFPIFSDSYFDSLPEQTKKSAKLTDAYKSSVAKKQIEARLTTTSLEITKATDKIAASTQEKEKLEKSVTTRFGIPFSELAPTLAKKKNLSNQWLTAYNNRKKYLEKGAPSVVITPKKETPLEREITNYPDLAILKTFEGIPGIQNKILIVSQSKNSTTIFDKI